MINPSPSLHVLLLVSNPLDAPVHIDRDVAALEEALVTLEANAVIHTMIAEAEAVGALLARRDRPRFQVLHFLGHGYRPTDPTAGRLCFESTSGLAREVDALTLAAVLNPTGEGEFAFAILSACFSQSLVPALLVAGIRRMIVIDQQTPVREYAAVCFCSRFYQVVLTGSSVENAFRAGINALISDEKLSAEVGLAEAAKFKLLPEEADWSVRLAESSAGDSVRIAHLPRPDAPAFRQRPAHFVGRNRDLATLLQSLEERRGLLIKGVSGVGKSELAREAAHWLVARRRVDPAAVLFVPLLAAQSADQARRAIARELGLRLDLPDDDALADAELAKTLPRRALLILDEAENLIAQGGLAVRTCLETLLQAPSRPRILITSQSDLGSTHFRVLPLERLTPPAALELFVQAVQEERRPPLLKAAERELLELLEIVDRIPRAIVLTAGVWNFSRSDDVETLLADLRQRRDQVMADPYYPAEVKSVTVGIQLAYDRLRQRDPAAAHLFVQLALFPGGLPEPGLPAIFGASALALLAQIENQSLAERPYPDLVYLPAPLRFFAERQLPDGVAAAQAPWGAAVLRFYFDFPDEAHRGWINQLDDYLTSAGEKMGALITRFGTELPSIEAWLDWGYTHEPVTPLGSRSARLTALLQNLYVVTSQLRLERRRFDEALAAAVRGQDRAGEANVQKALGDLEVREDQLTAARTRYMAALAIYPVIGARLGEANTYQGLGTLALREGNPQQAFDFYRQALEIHGAIGDHLGLGADFGYLARAAAAAGSQAQAVLLAEESLNVHRRIGSQLGQALNLDDQGGWLYAIDEQPAAFGAWWQALGLPSASVCRWRNGCRASLPKSPRTPVSSGHSSRPSSTARPKRGGRPVWPRPRPR
jgi:tetratricopeptide (TPR) repeat protein